MRAKMVGSGVEKIYGLVDSDSWDNFGGRDGMIWGVCLMSTHYFGPNSDAWGK